MNHLWFVCLNFGNASEAHLTHFLVFHLLFHLHSWIMCTLYSIFFYTCILMYTPPTFTPVFLYRVYFVFHLLLHLYSHVYSTYFYTCILVSCVLCIPPTLSCVSKSGHASQVNIYVHNIYHTTQPNPIAGRTMSLNNVHLLLSASPKCINSTALKIIMIKSKHVCSFCSKGGHGVLEYFLFLQSGERNGSF